jgi:hypothetical protein
MFTAPAYAELGFIQFTAILAWPWLPNSVWGAFLIVAEHGLRRLQKALRDQNPDVANFWQATIGSHQALARHLYRDARVLEQAFQEVCFYRVGHPMDAGQ